MFLQCGKGKVRLIKKKKKQNKEMTKKQEQEVAEELKDNSMEEQPITETAVEGNASEPVEEKSETELLKEQVEQLTADLEKEKKEYLFLMAEFDNFRKRSLKEKAELIKNGGETAFKNLLPVVDDFERALQNIRQAEDVKAVGEGVELIYNKFITYLAQQGVQAIEAIGKPFETELFEAIATIPAPEADLKGKVVDCVQTGYLLNEKVIRHAKVVVGE